MKLTQRESSHSTNGIQENSDGTNPSLFWMHDAEVTGRIVENDIIDSKCLFWGDLMHELFERYVVELEDGTFALWGQFVEGETQSILAMDKFCNASLFQKEHAERKIEQINKGVWKFLGDTKKAIGIRKVEMRLI